MNSYRRNAGSLGRIVRNVRELADVPAGTRVFCSLGVDLMYTKQEDGTWTGDKVNSFQRNLTDDKFTRTVACGALACVKDGAEVDLVKAPKGR